MKTFCYEEIMKIAGINAPKEDDSESYKESVHKRYDNTVEDAQKMAEAYDKMSHLVNVMGSTEPMVKALLSCVQSDHRTLQQSFFGVIFKLIEDYGKTKYFDLRNEASVKACKDIAQFIKDQGIYLPLV